MKKVNLKSISNKIEFLLAIFVIVGSLTYFGFSTVSLIGIDWSLNSSMYELINIVITTAVGIELAKILITHDIYSVSDLLVFVIARKLLQPTYNGIETLLLVGAFSLLILVSLYIRDCNKNLK